MSYKQVGTSRGWGIWQKNGQSDFIGNMQLSIAKSNPTATPDLVEEALRGDIGEYMLDKLEEHEAEIKLGQSPTPTPTPGGLTTAQKTYCKGRITYIEGHLANIEATAVKAPTVLAEIPKTKSSIATLKEAIIKDPITGPSGRPLGLARYHKRH
jgi:hypothetical protein